MGQRERERKLKQAAARAASTSSMRTVEENAALLPDNEMEVDAESSSAAASAAAPAASSGLQAVLRVRGATRDPSGTGSVTAPPGGPVSEGDSGAPQSTKRKEKQELKPEDVNPSGVVHPLPPGPLTLGASSSQGVGPWNWQEYDKAKKQKQPGASTMTTRAPTRETSLQPNSGAVTPADTKEEAEMRARGEALMSEASNVKKMLKKETAQLTCAPAAPQPDGDDDGDDPPEDDDKELPQAGDLASKEEDKEIWP
eukprot:4513321-Amphidinium_carterae.1